MNVTVVRLGPTTKQLKRIADLLEAYMKHVGVLFPNEIPKDDAEAFYVDEREEWRKELLRAMEKGDEEE